MSAKEVIGKVNAMKKVEKYELVAPEGGWGHIVTLAVAISFVKQNPFDLSVFWLTPISCR